MDPMINTAAIASAEKMINTALSYDPATRIALEKLAPQILALNITAPTFLLFVAPSCDGIRLLGHCEEPITTHISGTAPALIALIKSSHINLKDSGVQVIGSTHFLGELQTILRNLDIDWEEMLSSIFGDIIGHQSANIIRHKINWTKDRAHNIQRLTGEFLTEELSVLPSKTEINFFNHQVDDIRLDVDRIEARIQQITNQITHKKLSKS